MGPAVHDMDSNPEYGDNLLGVPPTYGSCSARFEFSRGSNVDSGRWKEKKTYLQMKITLKYFADMKSLQKRIRL